jgi:hypothetical protein
MGGPITGPPLQGALTRVSVAKTSEEMSTKEAEKRHKLNEAQQQPTPQHTTQHCTSPHHMAQQDATLTSCIGTRRTQKVEGKMQMERTTLNA